MKKLKFFAFLIISALLVISCSKDESSNEEDPGSELVGTWQLVEMNINPPQDINGDGNTTTNILTELPCVSGTIILGSDNTWRFTLDGVTITDLSGGLYFFACAPFTTTGSGVWQLQGNQLTLFQGGTPIFYSVNGDRITSNIGDDLPGIKSEVYAKISN